MKKRLRNTAIALPRKATITAMSKTSPWDKLHGVCSYMGVITHFDISKANVADIHYLEDIKEHYSNCRILGDKAYISNELQMELFATYHLKVETPMRTNQRDYHKQP